MNTDVQLQAKTAPSESLAVTLAREPTLTNFVNQAGLGEVAKMVEGDSFVVCDLELHGVQGCADLREKVANQQMVAECAAIGLALLAAVIAGTIAVVFVNLVTKLAAPLGRNRVYALFPRQAERADQLKAS